MPFGGLFSDIADHNRLLLGVFDGDWPEVEYIGEIE